MTRMWSRPDTALGLMVITFGILEAQPHLAHDAATTVPHYLIIIGMGAAVGLHRREPGLALGLVWIACGLQVISGFDITLVQLGVVVVAYGAARYGSTPIVWASALSIPAAYAIGATYVLNHGTELATLLGVSTLSMRDIRPVVVLTASAAVPLAVPWLIGIAMRMRDRARINGAERIQAERSRSVAETERAQAQEIARVREGQTRLARDVHDVVGHSLAVILAQAESARFLPDDDPARLKETMANIAGSARVSLGDVRRVLSITPDEVHAPPTGGLDGLVEGVRASGTALHSTVNGTPRPLPPEVAVVAYRVLQEMLTNSLKHGPPGEPVEVVRTWQDGLRIEVTNKVGSSPTGPGQGVDGMRQRLASVGGSLTVGQDGDSYAARAWLPLPGQGTQPIRRVALEGE